MNIWSPVGHGYQHPGSEVMPRYFHNRTTSSRPVAELVEYGTTPIADPPRPDPRFFPQTSGPSSNYWRIFEFIGSYEHLDEDPALPHEDEVFS